MDPVETITVEDTTVGCDGGTLGHPLVYLNLGPGGEVDCPYCGRRYVLAEGVQPGGGH
ncbi:MAG: zinc-finger domain-containing protein [Alphaproteobacteria bacterium]|nr:zinc-finger domain-containing protein [Pseudomonadota bacterium]TDI67968.1 MAG: zinc-finger domain-containing protein [Alphaproteobacteria bacterium]